MNVSWSTLLLVVFGVMFHLSLYAADRYDGDGVLSARLEEQRWLMNQARHYPEQEADSLGLTNSLTGGHPDYDVCEDGDAPNDFGTTPSEWAVWTNSLPPLAPNARLNAACANHADDMARVGYGTHQTPSGSPYYAVGSSGIARGQTEGYTNAIFGYYENIAVAWAYSTGGYPAYASLPVNVHRGLFIDAGVTNRGHRKAHLNRNAREVGLGMDRVQEYEAPNYWTRDYDNQLFGCREGEHFFTGTLFSDSNVNGRYDEGEGVGGVEIRLYDDQGGGTQWYDVSTVAGSFAIPISDVQDGALIDVVLVNTNSSDVNLSLPWGYMNRALFALTAGASRCIGSFTQPNGVTNTGFHGMSPRIEGESPVINYSQNEGVLSFAAYAGPDCVLQLSTNLQAGQWINAATNQASAYGTVRYTNDLSQYERVYYRLKILR